ncbi:MAG: bifunctional serine/threonine-protein kinase/formylglycine-generating enzyme family protein, partial [Chloroflexi bacterium]|nr:bifunctional serine/threonine-protein kinase/formylglycine-generating enzyme family protein [Chloroflexota bacterium]
MTLFIFRPVGYIGMVTAASLSFLKKGTRIGKYEIRDIVGRGGMSEVYRAYNPDLDTEVALKILHPSITEQADFTDRFRQEARAVAGLAHLNIVRIFDFDASKEGLHYMVMELLDGPNLRDVLAQYPQGMPLESVRQLFEQIGEAVHFAHHRGLLHRDIKPANIILTEQRAVLTDFGLAKIIDKKFITASENSTGTPAYMSPEQAIGRNIGFQSDIYSLGVVLYEMATGQLPFTGSTAASLILQHLQDPPPPPNSLNPKLPRDVSDAILRALEKQPHARFDSVREMVNAVTGSNKIDNEPLPLDLISGNRSDPYGLDGPTVLQTRGWWRRFRRRVARVATVATILMAGYIGFSLADDEPSSSALSTEAARVLVAPEGMNYVPSGHFAMGASDGEADEEPVHRVEMPGFYIDQYEVTNQDYYEFLEETGYTSEPAGWRRSTDGAWRIESESGYIIGDDENRAVYTGDRVQMA